MNIRIKKIIPYLLIILVILVGSFISAGRVQAQVERGDCVIGSLDGKTTTTKPNVTFADCPVFYGSGLTAKFNAYSATNPAPSAGATTTTSSTMGTCDFSDGGAPVPSTQSACLGAKPSPGIFTPNSVTTPQTKTDFETQVEQIKCSMVIGGGTFWPGCFVQAAYGLFYVIPSFLLLMAAKFFNTLIALTVYSTLFTKSTFIPTAWGVVRDLSNLFFILILLYIAIQLILDLGHDAKKMIVRVIIIALLINFSMFFTEVIIDTSNIIALVFYNKLNVDTKNPDGSTSPRPYDGPGKDISGGMVSAFNPASGLTWDKFFKQARTPMKSDGVTPDTSAKLLDDTPAGIILGILLVTGAVMFFAIYAFFISGIAFVGRLIELWVLIIFSPFAFMSSTIPILDKVDYIGWDAWFKRLLTVAFMAPIFMFFMYFIFLMIRADIFGNLIPNNGIAETLLLVVIPAMVILILLMKATEFAKKGSGKLGEALLTGAKVVGGLALGAATGGAAFLGSNTAGRIARNVANDDELRAKAAAGDKGAQRKLSLANSLAKNSFDFRQTGLGKFAEKQSGMDFNKGLGIVGMSTEKLKGGRAERDKEGLVKHEEKLKTYELTKSGEIKQNDRHDKYEEDLKKEKARPRGSAERAFDENKFRSDYEAGKYMSIGGKTVKVEAGSVQNTQGVNNERRKAYALSLENPDKKFEDGKVIKKGLADYASSFGAAMKDPRVYAATAAAIALTGPLGLLTPAVVGLANVIKDMTKDKLAANKYTGIVFGENKEAIAAVRKGKTANEKFLEALKNLDPKKSEDAKKLIKLKDEAVGQTPSPTASSGEGSASTGGGKGGGH